MRHRVAQSAKAPAIASKPLIITPGRARRIALHRQGLDGSWSPAADAAGASATIERLGYVQIDTITVIERAHEHTLWARQPAYRPEMLHELLAEQRKVFEYWTHAAAYVPMHDYRFYELGRQYHRHRDSRTQTWMRENRKVVNYVSKRIRSEGPLRAADFASEKGRGPWWGWKPAKSALECLFNTGELMISERRKFQRVYDLAERILPDHVDMRIPASEEQARWGALGGLASHGISDLRDSRYWRGHPDDIRAAMHQLAGDGVVTPVRLRGDDDDQPLYALTESLQATEGRSPRRHLHILSPFDNLVIRRPWLRRFFGFDYTIECYVPEKKRVHGYFCLPLLWGDCFIGRLDAKAERKKRVFSVRSLTFEPDLPTDVVGMMKALSRKLAAFAAFNGCDRTRLYSVRPRELGTRLRTALKEIDG